MITGSPAPICTTVSGATTCSLTVSQIGAPPVAVTVSNGQDPDAPQTYPLTATIDGSASVSGALGLFYFGAFGQQPNDTYPALAYVYGSPVTVINNADLSLYQAAGSPPGFNVSYANGNLTQVYLGSGGGAITAYSHGGDGFADNVRDPDPDNFDAGNGGAVSATHTATLTVAGDGVGIGWLAGIGAYSYGGNGAANKTGDTDYYGDGGNGGAVSVSNTGTINMSNSGNLPTLGVLAYSQGGGPGALTSGDHPNYYGASGAGGAVNVEHTGTISSSAPAAAGIAAISIGGDGGLYTGHGVGSDPGISGPGGAVSVTLGGGSSVSLSNGGIGVLAVSSVGPSANSDVSSGISGGSVNVGVAQGATVSVTGSQGLAIGVAAISTGSPDVLRPFDTTAVAAAGSGYSGAATVTNAGTITTSGEMAIGVAALSYGGAGILTTATEGTVSDLGNAAPASLMQNQNAASVTNTGAIVTNGASSFGILASSAGAGGVINAATNAIFAGDTVAAGTVVGGMEGSGGNGGTVTVSHAGTIATGNGNGGGNMAIGILAQSIGGSGGTTGGSAAAFVGDGGGTGGSGAQVSVTTQAGSQVSTYDLGAIGILAQSIGGGGGNGGNAEGLFIATGGRGGTGGNGGSVSVSTANSGNGGILTMGHFSAGVLAQSIGGGGGNGGYGKAIGSFISVGIGGTGGNGGAGGAVSLINDATLVTAGNQSHGMAAQSLGGGGGNGGAAYSISAGVLTASIALGGSGGDGGVGGPVTVNNNYHIYTGCNPAASDCGYAAATGQSSAGADSIGILAQSIGGGGGTGGAATAKAFSLPSDEIPVEFTFAASVGGSGGLGGNAGEITLANSGEVGTAGDGAHGVVAQSIGGGGGNGGDSTATTFAIESGVPSLKTALAIGGSGGPGGMGGAVTITNGASSSCTTCNAQIYTFGQYAAGILAQSIGGGGGTGAAGNASASSPNLGDDTGTSVDVTLALGGKGGSGGLGSTVTVTNDAASRIVTTGSGAQGILAQSIGGGGGVAGGGSAAASGDSYQFNLSLGGNGGSGGNGGTVTVTNNGVIATGALVTNAAGLTVASGGDGIGILAQSIGAGGGVGGTSDAAATIDIAGQVLDALNAPSDSYSANLGIGGRGGTAGSGGAVTVTNTGTISTIGIRAYGIEAQSTGAGGGNGGAATSSSNSVLGGPSGQDKSGTYSANLAIGGAGGAAGNGGPVQIGNNGAISTAGYAAHALFAQSIGGGGGVGAEGTVDNETTIGLGLSTSGNGGNAGIGGSIGISDSGTLLTAGDDAYGILAQTISGGGGLASAGCSNSAMPSGASLPATLCLGNSSVGRSVATAVWNDASDVTLHIGGSAGASGDAGNVTIDRQAGSIVTTGARAFAVAAQSIGGGGGLAAAADVNVAAITGSDSQAEGNGADISVSLASGTSIRTLGTGAFGVMAQSIGGGGGFGGDASLALQAGTANVLGGTVGVLSSSGVVTVSSAGSIITSGANAHGLFLQSLGGGGGAYGDNGQLLAGSNPAGPDNVFGNSGGVVVNQNGGEITASGAGSIGIFAQASGNTGTQNPVMITIAGSVTGGTGSGAAGIFVSGGVSSNWISLGTAQGNSSPANMVTVMAGGLLTTVDGAAGYALRSADGITNVTNAGTITGSIDVGNSAPDVSTVVAYVHNSGLINSGTTINAATLENSGTLAPFGMGLIGATQFTGSMGQTASGVLAVDIDVLGAQQADLFKTAGTASLQGMIMPLAKNLLPGTYDVFQAGSIQDQGIDVADSLLFDWSLAIADTLISISPEADFKPAGVALSGNEATMANYLQANWAAGGNAALAPLFGAFSQLATGSDYASALDDVSGQSRPNYASDQLIASRAALDAAFSCPVFEGSGTMMAQDECIWSRVSGGTIDHSAATSDYRHDVLTFRVGGQAEIAQGWHLGATGGFGVIDSDVAGDRASSNGNSVDAGVALKRVSGPWYFGAGGNIGFGWFDESRTVVIGSNRFSAESEPQGLTLSGRMRVAYELAFDDWYVTPYTDVDVIYSHIPGYDESGDAAVALSYSAQDDTTFGFSPMVEIGGRIDLGEGRVLRPYVNAGLVWLSQDGFTTQSRITAAPTGTGRFAIDREAPQMVGRLNVGMQVYESTNFDFRVEYDGQFGDDYRAQTGSVRLGYRF